MFFSVEKTVNTCAYFVFEIIRGLSKGLNFMVLYSQLIFDSES